MLMVLCLGAMCCKYTVCENFCFSKGKQIETEMRRMFHKKLVKFWMTILLQYIFYACQDVRLT